jgi:putative heme-binding domain-containing protein
VGDTAIQPRVMERVLASDWKALSADDKLAALRVVEIGFQRIEQPEPKLAITALQKLDALYPDTADAVNRGLAKLLCGLGAPAVVPRTLALMDKAQSQEERMLYQFALRNVRDGWSADDRRRYFHSLALMDTYRGGAGLPKFIEQIRKEALAAAPATEQAALQALLERHRQPADEEPVAPRAFVKRWTMTDLPQLATAGHKPDLQRGRAMFRAAQCGRCHTLGEEGKPFGPDLTNVASRFSRRDLLEAMVEPSKVVAESYRSVAVVTKDGESYTGQVVLEGDYRAQVLRLVTDPMQPLKVTDIPKINIASHRESEISPMPEGLLDSLTRDEILDLVAFLESGGRMETASRPGVTR